MLLAQTSILRKLLLTDPMTTNNMKLGREDTLEELEDPDVLDFQTLSKIRNKKKQKDGVSYWDASFARTTSVLTKEMDSFKEVKQGRELMKKVSKYEGDAEIQSKIEQELSTILVK